MPTAQRSQWPTRTETDRPWPLPARQVHVYRLRYGDAADALQARLRLIAPSEQIRSQRLRVSAKRLEFVLTRAALRRVLGAYLGAEPRDIGFVIAEHGKPGLAPIHGSNITFNISHSHGLALLAVTRDYPLGVDVEKSRFVIDYPRIARRFFSVRETQTLEALPPGAQQAAFFRCWSRKEAVIKGHGRGIALGLGNFDVTLAPGDPPKLEATRWDPPEAARWALHEINPNDGFAAALAVRAPNATLGLWSLTP